MAMNSLDITTERRSTGSKLGEPPWLNSETARSRVATGRGRVFERGEVRDNYDALAATVAQVFPVLLIALFVENRFLGGGPPIVRSARLWMRVSIGLGWLGLATAFAYLATRPEDWRALTIRLVVLVWLVGAALMAGSLAGFARAAIDRTNVETRRTAIPSQGATPVPNKPKDRNIPKTGTLVVLILFLARRIIRGERGGR